MATAAAAKLHGLKARQLLGAVEFPEELVRVGGSLFQARDGGGIVRRQHAQAEHGVR
jgi:hypothetical protein